MGIARLFACKVQTNYAQFEAGKLVAVLDFNPYSSACGASVASPPGPDDAPGENPAAGPVEPVNTMWADAWDSYIPSDSPLEYEPPVQESRTVTPAYEYPVCDITGTPRIWVNDAGDVLFRAFPGPYGEDLGYYKAENFTSIGFAGMPDERRTVGISYSPNRYLSGNGRFISADPSGSMNINDPKTLNQYAYVVGNPVNFTDPTGMATYLLLVGRGYQSTDPEYQHQRHDVGKMFEKAAETRAKEIRNSKDFDPKRDKVIIKDVGTGKEAIQALNNKYASGKIKDIETFSHGGKTALNFGEGPQSHGDKVAKWLMASDLAGTHPDLAPGAKATFNACDSGEGGPGGGSIAQAAANQWDIPVEGSPTTVRFDNPNPTAANPDVHMIPDYGESMITMLPR